MRQVIVNAILSRFISKSTRITPNSATPRDLSITNKPLSVLDNDMIPCPLADHELITLTVNYNLRKPERLPIVKKNFWRSKDICICSVL